LKLRNNNLEKWRHPLDKNISGVYNQKVMSDKLAIKIQLPIPTPACGPADQVIGAV
jgi:hypothetical protein